MHSFLHNCLPVTWVTFMLNLWLSMSAKVYVTTVCIHGVGPIRILNRFLRRILHVIFVTILIRTCDSDLCLTRNKWQIPYGIFRHAIHFRITITCVANCHSTFMWYSNNFQFHIYLFRLNKLEMLSSVYYLTIVRWCLNSAYVEALVPFLFFEIIHEPNECVV